MSFKLSNAYTEIEFSIKNEKILLKGLLFSGKRQVFSRSGGQHSFVFLTGGASVGRHFNRYAVSGETFRYVNAETVKEIDKQKLIITEANDQLSVRTVYTLYDDCAALCVYKEVTNISQAEVQLEGVSPLTLFGIMDENKTLPRLWKGYNTHCSEAMFERMDFSA